MTNIAVSTHGDLKKIYKFKQRVDSNLGDSFEKWKENVLRLENTADQKLVFLEDNGEVTALLCSSNFLGAPTLVRVINFDALNGYITKSIFDSLLDAIGGLAGIKHPTIGTSILSTQEVELELMQSMGFNEVARYSNSELNFLDWEITEIPLEENFKILSYNDTLKSIDNFDEKFYQLHEEIVSCIPESIHHEDIGLEAFTQRMKGYAHHRDLSFFIIDGGNLIGLSLIKIDGANATTLLTGIAKKYQRRGLARKLKYHLLNKCKSADISKIITHNENDNVSILTLNKELGFRKTVARLILEKKL